MNPLQLSVLPSLNALMTTDPAVRASPSESPFAEQLLGLLKAAQSENQQSDTLLGMHLGGEDVTQAELMGAMKKAELSLQLLLEVRNRLLEGFQELKQMQL